MCLLSVFSLSLAVRIAQAILGGGNWEFTLADE